MPDIVTMTEAAAGRLAEMQRNADGKVIRLSVKSSGCSGNRYDLSWQDAPGPQDEKVEAFGSVLYVDPVSLLFIAGTEIDWSGDGLAKSFSFNNPNETARCGCGESFACGA